MGSGPTPSSTTGAGRPSVNSRRDLLLQRQALSPPGGRSDIGASGSRRAGVHPREERHPNVVACLPLQILSSRRMIRRCHRCRVVRRGAADMLDPTAVSGLVIEPEAQRDLRVWADQST